MLISIKFQSKNKQRWLRSKYSTAGASSETMKSVRSWVCFRPRDTFKGKSKDLDRKIALWTKQFDSSFKLLLLGPAGAGKTTILKQMKLIHMEGFTPEERQQNVKEIRTNLLESVRELTSSIIKSGNCINWEDPENQKRLDFINGLKLDDATYKLYAVKIYDYTERILTDSGVEEHFSNLNQLSLTHRSKYLLTRVEHIRNANYMPNNDDILQSRGKTCDIQKIEFQVQVPLKYGSVKQTFSMFDVGGQRCERRKWIQVFDGVTAVMFLIDSSGFDAIDEESGNNKMKETMNLFHEVWTTRFLRNSNFVLLFNKQDILRQKIERGHRIEDHFPEYTKYHCPMQDATSSCTDSNYIKARSFIRDKFLQITRQANEPRKYSAPNLVNMNKSSLNHPKRAICYHYTTATDTENIRNLFDYLQEMVIKSTLEVMT